MYKYDLKLYSRLDFNLPELSADTASSSCSRLSDTSASTCQLMIVRDVLVHDKIIRATDGISNSLPRPLYGGCLDFFPRVP